VSCTYEDVANLLSNDLGLAMPAGNLESLGRVLANARSYEANQPSRPEMTKRIRRLHCATLEVREALESPHILSRLALGGHGFLEKMPDYWADMMTLNQIAEAALLTIPKGKGRTRPSTPKEISPRAVCALVVSEFFEASCRRPPGSNNTKAHAIAEALWKVSGGPSWTGHAKSRASWRPYFDEVGAASPIYRQALRVIVRRRPPTASN
jgi:hypothetical protein